MAEELVLGLLTPREIERLTADPRLRDYPAAEYLERRELGYLRLLRWLVRRGRFRSEVTR